MGDGTCEPGLASSASYLNPFQVLQLVEDLRLALGLLEHPQERAALLSQVPGPTAAYIKECFEESLVRKPLAWAGNMITGGTPAWGSRFICAPSSSGQPRPHQEAGPGRAPSAWPCPLPRRGRPRPEKSKHGRPFSPDSTCTIDCVTAPAGVAVFRQACPAPRF